MNEGIDPTQKKEVVEEQKTVEQTQQQPVAQQQQQSSQTQEQETQQQPTIDVEKIQKDIEGKVSQSVISKIGEALGLTKTEEDKLPTDPAELKAYVEELAQNKVQTILKSKEEQTQQEQEEQKKQTEQQASAFKDMWKRDYDEMASLGNVPKIQNPGDPNDPGNQAKTRILSKLKEVLDENEKKGIDYVPSLWEIVTRYPNVLNKETTAGSSFPVSGNNGSNGMQINDRYNRIHNTPIETILEQSQNN